jgi:hypothetical protein
VAVMVPVPRMGGRRRRNHDGDRQKCGSAKQIHHCCAPKNAAAKNGMTKPLFQTASLDGWGPSMIRRKAYIKYSPMCTIEHRCAAETTIDWAPQPEDSMARLSSRPRSNMPNADRVPMFQPCYRIHDRVEIRSDNPAYVTSLPRGLARNPLDRIASWLRMLFQPRDKLRQDL